MSQQIYKFASKGKTEYKTTIQGSESKAVRNTLSMKDLEQQLVFNFFETLGNKEADGRESDENEDEYMTVYLTESGSKEFTRYVLEVLTQIRNFYKLEVYADPNFEDNSDPEKQQIFFDNKMDEIKLEDYIKHIRAGCIKNDAN